MELYARMLILCLLCIARASERMPPEEMAELGEEALTYVEDLSRIPARKTNGNDGRSSAENPRDKRALGLLLSGLAQIFGYTVTPVQYASLSNVPNVTGPAAMSNPPQPMANATQQAAASRPMNATMPPRQQETIRFTGVVNLGNNSDIIGHLQRYEQLFHGRNNTTTTAMTTSQPPSAMPSAKISLDLKTDLDSKPPLLAPFFVKIPLPIAPELLPPAVPVENLDLSYPPQPVFIRTDDSEENTEVPVNRKAPVRKEHETIYRNNESTERRTAPGRKEHETIYRNNENTERYTVEEKDIYDERDVKKPTDEQYVEEPRWNKQQDDRRNELRYKEEERIKKLERQEEERNRDKAARYSGEEISDRNRNREEAIADRNRDYASKHEVPEERKPARGHEEDEDSAERYEEYDSRERYKEYDDIQENHPNESSKRPSKDGEGYEKEQSEDYPNYDDDDDDEQISKNRQPEDFEKYVTVGYNQQLPIGDYNFHEDNPEVIRNSYGEVLDDKKLEDDRIAGYISMFKQPYVRTGPEDASREENQEETSANEGYDEHLSRLQKLREEYASPENRYEEYDLNDEDEADRDHRGSERIQNRTSVRARRPEAGRPRDKEDDRAKTARKRLRDKEDDRAKTSRRPIGPKRDNGRLEKTRSREESSRYMPIVVPVRYVDASDKVQEATARQLNYKKADESTNSRFSESNVSPARAVLKEDPTPQIGLPERPRQLHEGEHKELRVWPPPFDYAFDNTEPANAIVPPNPQNYAPNYYQHVVKGVAAQDANESSEQPSGYLVVVDSPVHPYRYPYNIYYFSSEAVNSQSQIPHPSAEVTRQRDGQVYRAQQSVDQPTIQAKPNISEYNLNETTNSPRDYYHLQSEEIPASVLDHYEYIFGERAPQVKEPIDTEARDQIPNSENWSNRIIYHPQWPSKTAEQSPRPVFAQLQNVASSSQNARIIGPSEGPRRTRLRIRRESLRPSDQREDDKKAETLRPILKSQPKESSKSFEDPQSGHDLQPSNQREDDKKAETPRPILKSQPKESSKSFEDPQSGHDLQPSNQREDDKKAETPRPILKSQPEESKSFDDPQSAHDFFGFSKDDYNFEVESKTDATKAAEDGKIAEESDMPVTSEPISYRHDDEIITDELENDPEKAKVREYRHKTATLRVSEWRELKPNGPIHHVDFIRYL